MPMQNLRERIPKAFRVCAAFLSIKIEILIWGDSPSFPPRFAFQQHSQKYSKSNSRMLHYACTRLLFRLFCRNAKVVSSIMTFEWHNLQKSRMKSKIKKTAKSLRSESNFRRGWSQKAFCCDAARLKRSECAFGCHSERSEQSKPFVMAWRAGDGEKRCVQTTKQTNNWNELRGPLMLWN